VFVVGDSEELINPSVNAQERNVLLLGNKGAIFEFWFDMDLSRTGPGDLNTNRSPGCSQNLFPPRGQETVLQTESYSE
jgi:hypothetical protein